MVVMGKSRGRAERWGLQPLVGSWLLCVLLAWAPGLGTCANPDASLSLVFSPDGEPCALSLVPGLDGKGSVSWQAGELFLSASLSFTCAGLPHLIGSFAGDSCGAPLTGEVALGTPILDASYVYSPAPDGFGMGGIGLGGVGLAKIRSSTGRAQGAASLGVVLLLEDVNFPDPFSSLGDPMPSLGPAGDGVYTDPYEGQAYRLGAVVDAAWGTGGAAISSRTGINAVFHDGRLAALERVGSPGARVGQEDGVNELRDYRWFEEVASDGDGVLEQALSIEKVPLLLGAEASAVTLLRTASGRRAWQYVNLHWDLPLGVEGGIWWEVASDPARAWYVLERGETQIAWYDLGADLLLEYGEVVRLGARGTAGPYELGVALELRPCVGLLSLVEVAAPIACLGGDRVTLRAHGSMGASGWPRIDEWEARWEHLLLDELSLHADAHFTGRTLDQLVITARILPQDGEVGKP